MRLAEIIVCCAVVLVSGMARAAVIVQTFNPPARLTGGSHSADIVNVDVNLDSVPDFTLHAENYYTVGTVTGSFLQIDYSTSVNFIQETLPRPGDSFQEPPLNVEVPLNAGDVIGPSDTFAPGGFVRNNNNSIFGLYFYDDPKWGDGQPHYIGFQFSIGSEEHYGWIYLTGAPDHLNAVGYETTPGLAIVAPEPAALGTLGLGVCGLLLRRRSRLGSDARSLQHDRSQLR